MPATTRDKLPPALVRYTRRQFNKALERLAYQAVLQAAEEDKAGASSSSPQQTSSGRSYAEPLRFRHNPSPSTLAPLESVFQTAAAEAQPLSPKALRQGSIEKFLINMEKEMKAPSEDVPNDTHSIPEIDASVDEAQRSTLSLNPEASSFAPMEAQAKSVNVATGDAAKVLHAAYLERRLLPLISVHNMEAAVEDEENKETVSQHDVIDQFLPNALDSETEIEKILDEIVTTAIIESSSSHSEVHVHQQQSQSKTPSEIEDDEVDAVNDTPDTLLSEPRASDSERFSSPSLVISEDNSINAKHAPLPSKGTSMFDRLTIGPDGKPEREFQPGGIQYRIVDDSEDDSGEDSEECEEYDDEAEDGEEDENAEEDENVQEGDSEEYKTVDDYSNFSEEKRSAQEHTEVSNSSSDLFYEQNIRDTVACEHNGRPEQHEAEIPTVDNFSTSIDFAFPSDSSATSELSISTTSDDAAPDTSALSYPVEHEVGSIQAANTFKNDSTSESGAVTDGSAKEKTHYSTTSSQSSPDSPKVCPTDVGHGLKTSSVPFTTTCPPSPEEDASRVSIPPHLRKNLQVQNVQSVRSPPVEKQTSIPIPAHTSTTTPAPSVKPVPVKLATKTKGQLGLESRYSTGLAKARGQAPPTKSTPQPAMKAQTTSTQAPRLISGGFNNIQHYSKSQSKGWASAKADEDKPPKILHALERFAQEMGASEQDCD
ncbi:uncharacterized protein BDZ99DRAFT_475107 [Mytilinidion resinicola]|uniref:Uncharacterized protein n=1 Tax=Mytilinidion resinicola TaxID=574789 RepID=A0A6A6YUC5_9PEZI|nr:uncharacterized protein BDZ99DRAFT_475107 [Mytilinidion resinicola]KAF2811565.1 hypothetical protein BDZ99DRAFT_475107 [Mytilinidion resinicola]